MICEFCDYEWESRIQEPKACPRCKRRFDYPKEIKEESENE
ncbi:MAG: hypothetical protein ABIE22_05510 [archaeon]